MRDEKIPVDYAAGFEEIPHTADWAIRIWATDINALFIQAARGMNYMAGGTPVKDAKRITRIFETTALDPESRLVAFLSELIYYSEHEKLVFDEFTIHSLDDHLKVNMSGNSIQTLNKAIKAVTYHNLHIRETSKGLEVEIVFDV